MKRNGFTLLEVLVASVLMGMLVTILTMIFNQSAIAWRTGKAGVADMTESERNMARVHALADNTLPVPGSYCIVSPWKVSEEGNGTPSYWNRGVQKAADLKLGLKNDELHDKDDWRISLDGSASAIGGESYIVGVRSAGPDRKFGEFNGRNDDITTWPEKE